MKNHSTNRLRILSHLGAALLAGATCANAAISFNYDFGASVPTAARTSTMQAGDHIASLIAGSGNTSVDVRVTFETLGAGVLGGATPQSPTTGPVPVPGFGFRYVGHERALSGIDLNGADPDVVIAMGDAINWGFGRNSIAASEFSFFDTMVHEILHSIGYAEAIEENGSGVLGAAGTVGDPGAYTDFDQWLGDSTGGNIIMPNGVVDLTRWNAAVTGGQGVVPPTSVAGTDGLYFYGPNAMAANSGQPIPLYSPNPYESGSSVGHLDTDAFGTGTYIMLHSAQPGEHVGQIRPLELAMLQDVGFNIVPEPSTGILTGAAASLLLLRRRRRRG